MQKQDEVRRGVACYFSRCRRVLTADPYSSRGHFYCDEYCASEDKRLADIANEKVRLC